MDDKFLFYYGLVAFLNAAAGIFFAYLELDKYSQRKSKENKPAKPLTN